jgi:hypothetical protein
MHARRAIAIGEVAHWPMKIQYLEEELFVARKKLREAEENIWDLERMIRDWDRTPKDE